MRIGIDLSQLAYENTGVFNILNNLIKSLLKIDKKNEYVLFFSSLRRNLPQDISSLNNKNIKFKIFKLPPSLLDLIWNKFHIFPIEWFIGKTDIFITSDWTEPPSKAKKATILYDLVVYKTPNETAKKIVDVQKRKLNWVKKESDIIFCISESTKKDALDILGIEDKKLKIIYPSIN